MPRAVVHAAPELAARFAAIRARFDVEVGFPPEVDAEVAHLSASPPERAGVADDDRVDRRDLALVTLDPEGSRDLDQALHLTRSGDGWILHYAIADVGAWVRPGSALERVVRTRGLTVYTPDVRAPLHPPALSEGVASLLEGQERPALLWRIEIGADGVAGEVSLERALVRSTARLSYEGAQAALDAGRPHPQTALLAEIGPALIAAEEARGGVSLELPEQDVCRLPNGRYGLQYRAQRPVEAWNARLSLACGMAAAALMLDAGFGVLRTMPEPRPDVLEVLARQSEALGVPWPSAGYAAWVRRLDTSSPQGAALAQQATRLLRGAGYVAFDGVRPELCTHAAIAAPYAHVTAPLRRLVDRFANECVLAAVAGRRPEGWVVDTLGALPGLMAAAARRAGGVDRAVVDLVEASVLSGREGDRFDAVVVDTGRAVRAQLLEPAVVIELDDRRAELGERVRVRLDSVDLDGPTLGFVLER